MKEPWTNYRAMNKKPGQAVAALGAEVMDRGLRSQRGREDNRSGWASRQTGLASGRETESKQEHPAFFRGCYSKQLFIYSEVGDAAEQLSARYLLQVYQPGPRTLRGDRRTLFPAPSP